MQKSSEPSLVSTHSTGYGGGYVGASPYPSVRYMKQSCSNACVLTYSNGGLKLVPPPPAHFILSILSTSNGFPASYLSNLLLHHIESS